MNSIACLNVILEQIQENAHSFEDTNDLQKPVVLLFKLGTEIIQNSLSSALLKNVILAVKQLYKKKIIKNDDYKLFMIEVNNFYKSQSLCESYKLEILSCFSPAIETELISLLKLCSNLTSTNELADIQLAVERSLLVPICKKNIDITQKVTRILKKAFILSEGNPFVCYLTFCLCRSMEFSFYNPYFLSNELNGFDIFFQFPYNLVTQEDVESLIKHLIKSCCDSEKLKLCTKSDIIFYTTIYPISFHKMLDLSDQQTYILEFLRYLCNSNNSQPYELENSINFARENHIWKFLICL